MSAAKKSNPLVPPTVDETDAAFVALGCQISQALVQSDALDESLIGIRLQEALDVWRAAAEKKGLIE